MNYSIKQNYLHTLINILSFIMLLNITLYSNEYNISEKFENKIEAMLIIDPSTGEIVKANKSASKFYGYTVDRLQQMKIKDINTFTATQVKEEMYKAKEQNRNHFIFRHRLSDNRIKRVKVYSTPIVYKNKKVLVSTIFDADNIELTKEIVKQYGKDLEKEFDSKSKELIKSKKDFTYLLSMGMIIQFFVISVLIFMLIQNRKLSKKLKYSEDRLKFAIDGSGDGLWDWNIITGKVYFSKRWKEMLGFKENEIENDLKEWSSRVYSDDLDNTMKDVQAHIDGKTEIYENEHRLLCKDGSYIWILDRGKALFDSSGKAIRMLGFHTDITHRKEMEQKLVLEKNKAEKAEKAKSEFLANMSHEIRTPLSGILGFVDILKENIKDEQNRKYLEIIDNSSNHLLGVIEDILDFSKIESGKLEIEKIDFDVKEEFKSIINVFQAKADEKNIYLKVDYDENLPDTLNGDPLRIKQVISNLLSNAIKFTTNDKHVYVDINYSNDTLNISVRDEGIGIEKDKLKQVFDVFTQADNSTTREFGGSGLGLSISSELVKLMNGSLNVKSEINKGSEFYFSIPINKVSKKIKSEEKAEIKSLNGKVLVVEDNKANQMFIQIMLKKMKLDFEIANDGVEAVEKFKSSVYDVIFMDENMPNMNGREATKLILEHEKKNNLAHTPIIALTANALAGDREKFLNAGMDEYITKPFDKERIYQVLNMFLNKKNNITEEE